MKFLKRHDILVLILIFFIGCSIRSINLYDNFLFPYDQARDAQRVWSILFEKDLKIVGPETDLSGVFNGPLLYYLLVPLYGILNFNPNVAVIFFIIINSSMVFLIYYTARILFIDKKVGFIAALLWAVSFEQANYARFISNATLMAPFSLIFFLGLALYFIKDKSYGLIISIIGLGLAIQANVYLVYLGILYIVFFAIFPKRIPRGFFIKSLLLLTLFISSFLMAEIKWKFIGVRSLASFIISQNTGGSVIESLSRFVERISQSFYYSFFSFNIFFSFLFLLFCLVITYFSVTKRKSLIFLYIWVFSTLPLFAFNIQVVNTLAVNQTIIVSLTILVSLTLCFFISSKRYRIVGVLLLTIILLGIGKFYIQQKFNYTVLISQQPLLYRDEKNLIDYIYASSNNEPFSICALTNPLFINTIWSHLFNTYGKSTYKRLPLWAGEKQDLNKNNLAYDVNHVPLRYLIIEPPFAMIPFSKEATIYLEDHRSTLIEQKKIGNLLVQKRKLRKDNTFIDTQSLTIDQKNEAKELLKADGRFSCLTEYE